MTAPQAVQMETVWVPKKGRTKTHSPVKIRQIHRPDRSVTVVVLDQTNTRKTIPWKTLLKDYKPSRSSSSAGSAGPSGS